MQRVEPAGYRGDGIKCKDIDECEEGLAHCDQVCFNDIGGYHCDCREGFKLVRPHPGMVIIGSSFCYVPFLASSISSHSSTYVGRLIRELLRL
jgi:hypothetical protein